MVGNSNLDERQLQQRHKAGNQAFLFMAFLLLADMGLENYGIVWLEYPLSNYMIFMLGVGSYLVRLIWSGAYVGPGGGQSGGYGRSVAGAALAILVAACIIIVTFVNPSVQEASDGRANGPVILIIALAAGLIILSTVYLIRRRNNRAE
ncbi:hypothetical protein [Paenibacillus piscarius]|uniref:hypothetical protein n=1 Tax=Paenibacillus piscarius TaxID=1089681 RepID=UPI001EE99DF0|nr:hypothetical protein [Paenibacillus piscarius]